MNCRTSSVQSTTWPLRRANGALTCSSPVCVKKKKLETKALGADQTIYRTGAKLVLGPENLSRVASGKKLSGRSKPLVVGVCECVVRTKVWVRAEGGGLKY